MTETPDAWDVPLADADARGIVQVLDADGAPRGNRAEPDIDPARLREMYRAMVASRLFDERGWQLQRSGRVEFWIPSRGQEASCVGSAAAMDDQDWLWISSREPGAMMLRGADQEQLWSQVFGKKDEPSMGRRLPLLFSDVRRRIAPCTTQVGAYLPHAAGAAWANKLRGGRERFIVYFGDGATSRGEFHSALNFAGIHKHRIIFLCQNNGWAVSTPLDRQTATETFAEKAAAYNVRGVRVDGNDPLAVYAVTRDAHEHAEEGGATMIETVTYRLGFHTSSDNPDVYRPQGVVEAWSRWDPIDRMRGYLLGRGLWSEAEESELREGVTAEMNDAIKRAEAKDSMGPADLFRHIYHEETWMQREQRDRLLSDLELGAGA